jgi:hypothetical protein
MSNEELRSWLVRNWPKQLSNQFAIQQGTFTNDTPNTNSVTWAGIVVEYKGGQYRIDNGNTSNKWIYWELATPTVFASSASIPTITEDLIVVGVNLTGEWHPGWKAGQGIQSELIAGTIIADEVTAGAIDGMTITGAVIQTSASGSHAVMDSNGILFTDGSSTYMSLNTSDGSAHFLGETYVAYLIASQDIEIVTDGKGVILTNAAGTVTKRVRLNDAGDGLIFETP